MGAPSGKRMSEPSADLIWKRWDEVDHLFDQALDLAEEERVPFLEDACAGDTLLLDTLSRLLEASSRAAGVLSGPGSELLQAAFVPRGSRPSWPNPRPGAVVGRYRLIREIGRGGMANVYEAERTDGVLGRRVAVKLLRGVDSEDVTQRFGAERRILSSLAHPNIARLLDGGATEAGRPYFVMELVRGEPVTRWADRRRLGIPERLRLFVQVLDAVQYAHSRLVVHRDIKPSNVFVSDDGRVHLLDFGIAKLLDDGEDRAPLTRPATRWMTPEYASPEQILAQPITTATDVHALGVLLYELLAGRRPFGSDGEGAFELERAICEDPPAPPSSAATLHLQAPVDGGGTVPSPEAVAAARGTLPPRLRRALAGDLDAVVGKALRKQPEERYRSAQEMADDLMRFLSGFPVRAREGLRMYRARKFVRRHWLAVTATAALMVVLAASAAILTRLQAETARQRNLASAAAARAETEAENAGLVIDFLADVFRSGDPSQAPNDTLTARGLVEWGAQRVDSEFTDRPAVQARLLLVLGEAYENLGLPEEGAQLMQKALVLRRRLFGEESEETAEALLQLAELQHAAREISLAIPLYEEALHVRRSLSSGDGRALAPILSGLGLALAQQERTDSAELLLREAVAILSPYPVDEASISASLDLAQVLRFAGKLEEAASLYEEGIPEVSGASGSQCDVAGQVLEQPGLSPQGPGRFRRGRAPVSGIPGAVHPALWKGASHHPDGGFESGRRIDPPGASGGGHRRLSSVVGGRRGPMARGRLAGDLRSEDPWGRAPSGGEDRGGRAGSTRSRARIPGGARAPARVDLIRPGSRRGNPGADRRSRNQSHLHGPASRVAVKAAGRCRRIAPPATAREMSALLAVLDDVGLEEEYDRFSELLGKSSAGGGGT